MYETLARRDEHVGLWLEVFDGDLDVAHRIFDGFAAAVDWPTSALWQEMADLYPDVPVVLTRRSSADAWWDSASKTVFAVMKIMTDDDPAEFDFIKKMLARFRPDIEVDDVAGLKAVADDEAGMKAAYERHLGEVRAAIDPARLVEHEPADGWEPLCEALGVPVPDEPYPYANTADEFIKYFEENPLYPATG
jgi:hypothetical protein